jgi:alpha-mannosidase
LEYAGQIIGTGLSSIASEIETQSPGFLVFNPLGRPWSGPVSLRIPEQMWSEGLRPTDVQGESLPVQAHRTADGEVMAHVWLDGVPSVGYQFVALEPKAGESEARATSITRTATELMLETKRWRIVIDIASGAVTSLHDLDAGADWGRADLFNICSLREAGNDVTLRMDAAAPPVRSVSVSVDVTENGPLFTRVQLTKRIHDASVIQTITVWSRSERVDVETRIRWWGERNVQIRMTLPSPDSASDIAYGTPFYGSGWTDVVLDAAPRNPDEILPSDYHAYREVQQWLHLRRSEAGLLLVTSHPGFHFGDEGPAAVLMRTSPSCGDPRLFWENPGEQVYRFSMVPTGPKWQAARPFDVADGVLRTPEAVFTDMRGTGSLPNTHSLLTLESESAVLSSLSQREGDGAIRIRVFEGTGAPTSLSVSGPLVEDARVQVVDLLDRPIQGMRPETTSFDLPPWRIQTLRVTRNPTT